MTPALQPSISAIAAISSEVHGDINAYTCIPANATLNTNSAISLPAAATFATIATSSACGIAALGGSACGGSVLNILFFNYCSYCWCLHY